MKVAVVQPRLKLGRKDANLRTIARETARLAKREVGIACFPELATSGYALYEKWPKFAEPVPGPTTDKLGRVAREHGIHLIFGMPEKGEGEAIHDSAVLLGPGGDVDGVYRKVHLWDKERVYFTRGDGFQPFRTKFGKIGIGICYDIEFPEAARAMALTGAKLLFFPSAEPSSMRRLMRVYVKSRAAENCVFVAFANYSGKEADLTYLGASQIASPTGDVLAFVKGQVGSAVAELDFKDLDKLRVLLPYLEQRVPSTY
jgi:predicted amidohydrolase